MGPSHLSRHFIEVLTNHKNGFHDPLTLHNNSHVHLLGCPSRLCIFSSEHKQIIRKIRHFLTAVIEQALPSNYTYKK